MSKNLHVRATTADTKVCEERRAGSAPGTAAHREHGKAGFLPADMEVHAGAEIHLQTCRPWRTPHWNKWMPEGACDLMTLEQVFCQDL